MQRVPLTKGFLKSDIIMEKLVQRATVIRGKSKSTAEEVCKNDDKSTWSCKDDNPMHKED